jgi:hypothetical protein
VCVDVCVGAYYTVWGTYSTVSHLFKGQSLVSIWPSQLLPWQRNFALYFLENLWTLLK